MSIFGTPSLANGGSRNVATVVTTPFVTNLGDLIIVGAGWSDSGTISSVVDSAGNTYAPEAQQGLGFSTFGQYWVCLGATHASATNVVTITYSDPTNNNTVGFVWDVPLTGGVAAVDVVIAYSGSTNKTTAPFSTAGTDEFVAIMAYDQFGGGGYTADAGYTLDSASFGTFGGAQHALFSSPQTGITATFPAGSGGSSAFGLALEASTPTTFSISGNAGIAGATVNLTGTSSATTTADGSGNYSFTGLSNGPYTVTPSLAGQVFTPTSRNETVASANITGVDFTASTAPTGGGSGGSRIMTTEVFGAEIITSAGVIFGTSTRTKFSR